MSWLGGALPRLRLLSGSLRLPLLLLLPRRAGPPALRLPLQLLLPRRAGNRRRARAATFSAAPAGCLRCGAAAAAAAALRFEVLKCCCSDGAAAAAACRGGGFAALLLQREGQGSAAGLLLLAAAAGGDSAEVMERSWAARFSAHASAAPDKALYRWLDDRGREVAVLSYREFDRLSSRVAEALLGGAGDGGWGLARGDRVLLVYPPGLDFIVAFVGCLKAGVVAVPVYPPRPGQLSKDLNMFVSVQSSSGAAVALTNTMYDHATRLAGFKALLTGGASKWPELRWLLTDDARLPAVKRPLRELLEAQGGGGGSAGADSLAFLQYTSGSTSQPKGVMISQGNLAHNLSTIIRALRAGPDTVVVSWLPCYHDMGLIGSLLGAAYCGGSGAYMSPVSFIKAPLLWLEMANKYRATHLQAPNFAFRLVVKRLRESLPAAGSLDLSCLQHIFNAAEPIEVAALDDFVRALEPFKLPRAALSPGYGLAEHTVYVCDHGQQRLLVDKAALEKERKVVMLDAAAPGAAGGAAAWIVGCGDPHRHAPDADGPLGIQVRIVDDETCEALQEGRVGEIWVDSPSKAQGYFGQPEKTQHDFFAKLGGGELRAGDAERAWLRTGDLGFLHQGELFVCGRIKDLVIVRGRNHFPQDIEHTVEQADPLVRPGCVAAFTVSALAGEPEARGEQLAVVAELRESRPSPELEQLAKKLRLRVSAEHGVLPYVVVLIKDRSIPKTTSGKISRYRVRAALEQGALTELYRLLSDPLKVAEQESLVELEQQQYPSGAAAIAAEPPVSPVKSATAPQSAARPALVPIGAAQDPKLGGMPAGAALTAVLKDEVARLIEGDPAALSDSTPLVELGMDSMALTQFKGLLATTYGTDMAEAELFDRGTTLEHVRRRVEGAPPDPRFVAPGAPGAPRLASAAAQPMSATNAQPANAVGDAQLVQQQQQQRQEQQGKQRKQRLFGCFAACGC